MDSNCSNVYTMNDAIYHYVVNLPPRINEAVMACADGYTIYTSDRLDEAGSLKAYNHALKHIANDDFHSDMTADQIEYYGHEE